MNVTLYKYTGDVKVLDKTMPTASTSKKELTNVYLKDGSSVTHPSLLITSDTSLYDYNYCYIPSFNRYYFMEVDSITNKLWEFKCSVDVLKSNVTAIDSNYAYIERSESLGNPLIVDDADTFENVNVVTLTNLSGETQGDKKNISLKNVLQGNSNITLSVINDLNIQAYDDDETMYQFSVTSPVSCLENISIPDETGISYYNYLYVTDLVKINTSLKNIYKETESTFIKSVIVFPFELVTLKERDAQGQLTNNPKEFTLRLGNGNYGSNNVYKPRFDNFDYLTFFDYTFPSVTSYKDYEPYTTYELYIPYVGWRSINISDVVGSRVILTMRINYENGKGTIYLVNVTKDYIIASFDAQIGVVVPISRSNLEELNAQSIANAISMVIGVVGGAVTTTLGIGNPIAVAGGILTASSAIAKGVSNHIGMFEKGQAQVRDAFSGLDSRNIYLKVTSRNKITSPNAQMGTPVKRVALISSCSGFTQAKINKLDGINASKWEKDEIIRLFQEGIII